MHLFLPFLEGLAACSASEALSMFSSLIGEELCFTRRPFLAAGCASASQGDLRLLPEAVKPPAQGFQNG